MSHVTLDDVWQEKPDFWDHLRQLNWPLIIFSRHHGRCRLHDARCRRQWRFPSLGTAHAIKFMIGFLGFWVISFVPLRIWKQLAIPGYLFSVLLLGLVSISGAAGGGAARWLSLGGYGLQPSELVKVTVIVMLAALYAQVPYRPGPRLLAHLVALVLIAGPAVLVLTQPDLGTALLLTIGGIGVVFLAGVPLLALAFGFAGGLIVGGVVYFSYGTSWQLLKDYQYERILTFLDPSRDPLGSSYHLTQSLVAFGAGGAWGAGLQQGSQSSLDFLPEKHTDFLFAALAEQLGIGGSLFVLIMNFGLILIVALVLRRTRDMFSRLMVSGVGIMIFLYFAVNMGMVMGLLPVVGVPLPLFSHGGSAMLAVMFGLGLVHSAHLHQSTA